MALTSLRPPRPNPAPVAGAVSGVRLSAAPTKPELAVDLTLACEGFQVVVGTSFAARCRHRHALVIGSVVFPADSLARAREDIASERAHRDRLLGLLETVQRSLTDQRPRRSWWARLFGR